ncbi:MAG TPA: SDR family oxidoreductase [Luteimonas sp.]|nr:SDR family oxidoreductase [Luteimonas sp.]
MHTSDTQYPSRERTALVVGANGFLGGYIVSTLRRHGWCVLRGVRPSGRPLHDDERACDFTQMSTSESWRDVLNGVDAVVNAAGILRETGAQTFETIHVTAPLALAQACIARGVGRFVQISALGVPADGEFIASKHRFDEALLALPLHGVALRPSVVYAPAGSYGGTSLLRALAAFPGFQLLPGHGNWPIQPVAAEDLGTLVALSLQANARGVYEVGGPTPMTLRDYQRTWRRWMRISGARALRVPEALVSAQVWLWERLGRGPVGETMWRMLRRGNVIHADAAPRLQADFGFAPRALDDVLATHPSQVQDRWQAQLYFLAPTLRIAVVTLWLLSALAGLVTPAAEIERLSAGSMLQQFAPVALARAGGVLDLVLALWLASGWRPRLAVGLMGVSVLAYTLVFGGLLPALWLEPLGSLAKNLVLLPALAVLWVLVDRR